MAKEYKIDDLISSEELYHHGIKGLWVWCDFGKPLY